MSEDKSYLDFLCRDLAEVDPDTQRLIDLEQERQARRFIFVPSESICPRPVREALGSVFTNVYAEGYPPLRMTREDEELLTDFGYQLANFRRYSDRRFYRGTDYVNFVECLAQRRAADCFATESVPAQDIYVNVQPLSGAGANLAVYDALLQPGDTLMGMNLFQGGHLTHGSEFNASGKRYNVVSYGVDPKTQRLDYDAIKALALKARPKLIVAGFTSYPWAPDWDRFAEIARACGAILMADIAHIAGLVSAGVVASPVGHADVISFTTHKTMCGPRGAVIMTTRESYARKIDAAVFPGLQGGPHTNKFAAMAVAFKIAQTPAFKALQQRIVENAQALAAGLQSRGLRLAYGGTNTHMLLIDLRALKTPNGIPLLGEPAARILDFCGLVANKNTLPGDTVTALASGIRLGTPWLSQRGMGPAEMDLLAGMIHKVLSNIHPFYYVRTSRETPRAKLDWATYEEVKREVDDLAARTPAEETACHSGYPHYMITPPEPTQAPVPPEPPEQIRQVRQAARQGAACLDLGDSLLLVRGDLAKPFLQSVCTGNIAGLAPGQAMRSLLLDRESHVMGDITLWRLEQDKHGWDRYLLTVKATVKERVTSWLRGLSDAYILFDQDIVRKIPGPAVVEDCAELSSGEFAQLALFALQGPKMRDVLQQVLPLQQEIAPGAYHRFEWEGRPLWLARLDLGAQTPRYAIIVSEAQRQPLAAALQKAGAALGGFAADAALRAEVGWPAGAYGQDAAAIYQAHPALFDLTKPYFVGQAGLPKAQPAAERPAFRWNPPAEQAAKRTPLYETHRKLTRKMAPFAGWEMPLWYSSVGEEHQAVRTAAGLFDVTHMGALEIAGEDAAAFIDLVFTNHAAGLGNGHSSYGYLMDPDGHCIDDIMIYRRAKDRFLVVVNAANTAKDLAWLRAVNAGEVLIDRENPALTREAPVVIRDLGDPSSGADRLVDLALQGPRSQDILLALIADPASRDQLAKLERTHFIEAELAGIPTVISQTGYAGEDIAYELFVHPDQVVRLWDALLEAGAPHGLKPCGLAARDSLRLEAGLPLYGHELGGRHDIVPAEAGYAAFVKFHKPYFVGRAQCLRQEAEHEMTLVRFRVDRAGARAIHQEDPLFNRQGSHIGWVTSCTLIGGVQMGLALVQKRHGAPDTPVSIFPLPPSDRMPEAKPMNALQPGDRVLLHEGATILSRFPGAKEKKAWRAA